MKNQFTLTPLIFLKIVVQCIIILVLTTGCKRNYYNLSYLPNTAISSDSSDVILLNEGQDPSIIQSENIDVEIDKFKSQGYMVLGTSIFEAGANIHNKPVQQAKIIGATHILVAKKYLRTASITKSIGTAPPTQGIVSDGVFYPNISQPSAPSYSKMSRIYQHVAVYLAKHSAVYIANEEKRAAEEEKRAAAQAA